MFSSRRPAPLLESRVDTFRGAFGGARTAPEPAAGVRLANIRERLRAMAARHDRTDLVDLLTPGPADGGSPVRVVVAGDAGCGKSSLVAALTGVPLAILRPATVCWIEIGYGEPAGATALLADRRVPLAPRRVPVPVDEVYRYPALGQVSEPVLGMRVRLAVPELRGLSIVDTPGLGGLHAGYGRAALAAAGRADALLLVCDGRRPVTPAEVAFLGEAVMAGPAVLVAATRCDDDGYLDALGALRARLAEQPNLAGVPVLPVSAYLAEHARAGGGARLAALSGVPDLREALRARGSATARARRATHDALLVRTAAASLAGWADRRAAALSCTGSPGADGAAAGGARRNLVALRTDRERLHRVAGYHLGPLRTVPGGLFESSAAALRTRYRLEADRGPVGRLDTLGPRLLADLAAAGSAACESTAEQVRQAVRELLRAAGAGAAVVEPPVPPAGPAGDGAAGAGLFAALAALVAGQAPAVPVLPGSGVTGASVALAAGTGWWQAPAADEAARRMYLAAWVETAVAGTVQAFGREVGVRLRAARRHVETVLPDLLALGERELAGTAAELSTLDSQGTAARRAALAQVTEVSRQLHHLIQATNELADSSRVPPVSARF